MNPKMSIELVQFSENDWRIVGKISDDKLTCKFRDSVPNELEAESLVRSIVDKFFGNK